MTPVNLIRLPETHPIPCGGVVVVVNDDDDGVVEGSKRVHQVRCLLDPSSVTSATVAH